MYCKNCGNELNENDKFCSKCGFKISNDFQENPTLSTTNNTKFHTIKKFSIYLLIFLLFLIFVYIIFPPKNFDIVDFIIDPAGLTSVIGEALGGGSAILISLLPLLYGMKKLKIINKTYKLEILFISMFIFELGNWTVESTFLFRNILGRILEPSFIAGGLMLAYARLKKKV